MLGFVACAGSYRIGAAASPGCLVLGVGASAEADVDAVYDAVIPKMAKDMVPMCL